MTDIVPHADLRERVYENAVEVLSPDTTPEQDAAALREQYSMLSLLYHHQKWLAQCLLFLEDVADDDLGDLSKRAEELLTACA